jgi:hypothetical protein
VNSAAMSNVKARLAEQDKSGAFISYQVYSEEGVDNVI